jgi:hypothetical protein
LPTLSQKMERYQKRIRECSVLIDKWGPDAHCATTDDKIIVMEQVRAEQMANKPDADGWQKTRISIQLYSPAAYQNWAAFVEHGMEACNHNPLLWQDLIELLWKAAEVDGGINVALDNLHKLQDYRDVLHEAKEAYKAARKRRAANRAGLVESGLPTRSDSAVEGS